MRDSRGGLPQLDVSAALAIERDRPGPDAATRARSLARLRDSIALGIGPESKPPHEPPARHSPDTLSAERPSAVRGARTILSGLRLVPRTVLGVGCFLLGVGTGAGMHAALQTRGNAAVSGMATGPRPPATPTDSPPGPAAPYAETRSSATSAARVGPDERATDRARAGTERRRDDTSAPLPTGTGLAAERALLDVARSAYARGEPREALQALDRHARQFPQGTFNEEREALAVKCLRAIGRSEEAGQRAASFKVRYPNSLFLSAIDGPVESNP